MTGSGQPQAAVLDIGKTNLKLVLVGPEGHCTASVSRVHDFLLDEPYPAIDVDGIIGWFLDGLAELAGCHRIGALVTTAHGGGGVLVDESGPVLPMMDYEAATPPGIDALYAVEGPPYEEVFSFTGAGAMQLAKQLLWQAECFPQAFARARHFLTTAQYVAWRLGGGPASEVSQLGAQGQVWSPRTGTLSNFVRRRGFERLFPPLSRAIAIRRRFRHTVAAAWPLSKQVPEADRKPRCAPQAAREAPAPLLAHPAGSHTRYRMSWPAGMRIPIMPAAWSGAMSAPLVSSNPADVPSSAPAAWR